jgi:hypothetical protein
MSKSKGIHGTPYNFVGPAGALVGNREGFTPGIPKGYQGGAGTVLDQFEGDQSAQPNPRSGTPYQDRDGNPDESMRTAFAGRYGVSPGAGGVDMNDPKANGNGVLFDGMSRANALDAGGPATTDSPVSRDAPTFSGRDMVVENQAHLGTGNELAVGTLLEIGGTMVGDD